MSLKEIDLQVKNLEKLKEFAGIILAVTKNHPYSEEKSRLEDTIHGLMMSADEKILNLAVQAIKETTGAIQAVSK